MLNWLNTIGLGEYAANFAARNVLGAELSRFDRAGFTQLGVTRVRHRQTMEASLREYAAAYR